MTVEAAPAALFGRSRVRALVGPVGMATIAVGAAALVFAVDPNEPGHYPSCPFLVTTGWYCPGCGTLRAAHALLHGDLAGALDMNLLAVLAIPVVAASWVAWLRRALGTLPRTWLAPPWFGRGVLALLVVFTIARNIPAFAPALAP